MTLDCSRKLNTAVDLQNEQHDVDNGYYYSIVVVVVVELDDYVELEMRTMNLMLASRFLELSLYFSKANKTMTTTTTMTTQWKRSTMNTMIKTKVI